MGFTDLSHISFYEKEHFDSFFNDLGEKMNHLFALTSKTRVEKPTWQACIVNFSSTCRGIHLLSEQKEFLLIFESKGDAWSFVKCFRVYLDWKEDPKLMERKDFILRSTEYDRYTDHIPGASYTIQKPNLAFFKSNSSSILDDGFYINRCIYQNDLAGFPIELPICSLSSKAFFFHYQDISDVVDAIDELLGTPSPRRHDLKLTHLFVHLKQAVNQQFSGLPYDFENLIRQCKKKRARSEKTKLRAKYPVAWQIKTKDGLHGVSVRMHNWNTYGYAFVLHEDWILCYELFQDWHERILDAPHERFIELLSDYHVYETNHTAVKPSLDFFLKHRDQCNIVFSYDTAKKEIHVEAESIHHAAKACDLIPWFDET